MSAAQPGLNIALDALEDDHGLNPSPEDIYDAFTRWVQSTGKQMYPHQEEALLNIVSDDHVIVSTPTGSGKSMIAMQALFTALATGRTAYYTAPLKALVSEKFFELIGNFGPHNVGMVTGDSSINADAPIICATAEILANIALREGDQADVGMVVMDEFHFYDDPQRGWAWQVPLLTLPQAQQILLSATLGDTTTLVADLTRRTHRQVSLVTDAVRPVPLHFTWSTEPIGEVIKELVATHMAPVYAVHFSQRDAVSQALALQSLSIVSKEQKERIAQALSSFTFSAGFGKVLSKLLRAGIGVHHAGLLPRYRRLVERLAQNGLLNVICGTDTLGVGINVPIRTVVMTSLTKFDGTKQRHITAREFHQIAGRAGRAGYDTVGYVVVQAPEHEIENARRLRKAGDDLTKIKRVQKVKAPEGEISWSETTFTTLKDSQPETLSSRMRVDHSLILNLLQRPDPIAGAKTILCDNHEPHRERNTLVRKAITIYQSLRTAGVITHEDRNWRAIHGPEHAIHFTKDVPSDFALNSPLAPFALAAFDLLDTGSATYPLDVVSAIEAVSEDPTPALYAQQRQARGELIGKLKADGVDYDERMALADEVTWPRPLAQLLEPALETYAKTNPWVRGQELKPKSVVRQLIEEGLTFSEFISRYDLARSEGVLLRYITDVYRAMRQSIPLASRTSEVEDIIDWLARLVRSVDSSLLDEWEALADGRVTLEELTSLGANDSVHGQEVAFGAGEDGTIAFTRNTHALRVAVRNAMFYRIELLDREDYAQLQSLDGASGWDAERWADAIEPYFDEYDFLGTDQHARSSNFFSILEDPSFPDLLQAGMDADEASNLLETHHSARIWLALQVLDSGDDAAAWGLWALIDLDASDEANSLVIRPIRLGER